MGMLRECARLAASAISMGALSAAHAQQAPGTKADGNPVAGPVVAQPAPGTNTPVPAAILSIPLSPHAPAPSGSLLFYLAAEFDAGARGSQSGVRIEYVDAAGASCPIRTLDGTELAADGSVRAVIEVPAAALHVGGELRLVADGPTAGAWRVQSALLVNGAVTVGVRTQPAGVAEPAVSPRDAFGRDPKTGGTPLCFEIGRGFTAIAPLRNGEFAFDRWSVDGAPRPLGQNVLDHVAAAPVALVAEYGRIGDLNGDTRLDRFDLEAFVLALVDPATYAEQYPGIDRVHRGDLNADGVLTDADIPAFVDALLQD